MNTSDVQTLADTLLHEMQKRGKKRKSRKHKRRARDDPSTSSSGSTTPEEEGTASRQGKSAGKASGYAQECTYPNTPYLVPDDPLVPMREHDVVFLHEPAWAPSGAGAHRAVDPKLSQAASFYPDPARDRTRAPFERLPPASGPGRLRFPEYTSRTSKMNSTHIERFFETHVLTHAEIDYIHKLPHAQFKALLDSHEELDKEAPDVTQDATHAAIPIRYRVLLSPLPAAVKNGIISKLNMMSHQPMQASDAKYMQWVETCLQLPLGKLDTVGLVTVPGDTVACKIDYVAKQLDRHIYGHKTVKQDMLRRLAQNNDPISPMVLLGPPGVGKPRLVKHAMAKVTQRKFIEIPLGGATNADFLRGSLYVYEGSSPGHLTQGLIRCRSMNPIIFFDELCKVSGTAHGAEVMAVLMHITDQSQQHDFEDKYLFGVPLDLSKCQLMFAANDIDGIDPILRDRLEVIKVSAYTANDKREILKRHLIPDLQEELHITYGVTFSESAVQLLLSLTEHEPGVRALKRYAQHVLKALNAVVHVLDENDANTSRAVESMGIDAKILDFVRTNVGAEVMVISKDVTDMLLSHIDTASSETHPSLYL